MQHKKSLRFIFPFLLNILLALIIFTPKNYTQQEERSSQPQLTRNQTLFPLQSTGIWTEVHPLIPRVVYFGVHFANADTGWAVGEGGAIIKTTNGGEKWQWIESGVENTLKTVYSVNNGQSVITAGDGGVILISEDTGETWNTIPSGTTENIWNMQMITEEIGWMVGESSTALKTTDGGLTWTQQQTPYTNLPYWDISIVDTNYGYIACNNAIILKTTNGGIDWQIQIAGDYRSLFTIYAFDSLKVIAGGLAGKMVMTTNGGNTWTQFPNVGAGNFNRIKFIDPLNGFAVSTAGNFQTTDGGYTWIDRNDLHNQYGSWNINFADTQNGYIVGAKMWLIKTSDAGISWSKTIINDDFLNVYFKDEQNGIINSSRKIYKTTDGGTTLNILESFPYNEIYGTEAMTFTDSLTGYIGTVSLSIYKTTDGGESWYISNITGLTDTIGRITKFFFINPEIGWAVSEDGKIFKTIDSGDNWFIQFSNLYWPIFTGIFFVDSLYGWAVGAGARPYKTTDGGNNWIEQSNILNNFCRDVYFKNVFKGYIVRSNYFYESSDGGGTWWQDSSFNGFEFARFTSYDTNNIFLTGTKVYRTTNAGNSWSEFPEVQGQGLVTSHLVTVNLGYFVGNIGLIIKYFDESVPVELINFNGRINGSEVFLEWFTATEINNQGFEVLKSNDKQSWETIAFVEGNGTTISPQNYIYTDEITLSGTYFYQLKQIDYDGSFEYSNIIEVYIDSPSRFSLSQNYPNPFNNTTNITFQIPFDEFVYLKIYDILGNEVKTVVAENKKAGYYKINYSEDNLSSGIYFYKLTAGEYISTKKFILLK